MNSVNNSSFWSHLEELRLRLIRVALFLIGGTLTAFYQMDVILPVVVKPAGHLVFTSPADAFNAQVGLSIIAGFVIASPIVFFEVWSFIKSALTTHEKKLVYIYAPLSLGLFLLGVLFAFFIAVPMTYQFLIGFGSTYLQPMVTIDKYMNFVAQMVVAFGVAFQLPLILAFLARIGIATPAFLIQMRRQAYLIILIVAAVLTPPDVMSQILLGVPLILLYEFGIVLMKMSYKHKTL